MAHGDLGTSFRFGRPVTTLLVERLPVTLELSLSALTIATIVGILLGTISAVRRNSPVDVGTMLLANVGVSMPVFWLGLMLAYLFALVLKGTPLALPSSGRNTPGLVLTPLVQAWHLPWTHGVAIPFVDVRFKHESRQFPANRQLAGLLGHRQAFDPAGRGPQHHSDGTDRPHDTIQLARSAEPGLHPHCPGQGSA